jgi:hypothetical protein
MVLPSWPVLVHVLGHSNKDEQNIAKHYGTGTDYDYLGLEFGEQRHLPLL